MAAAALLPLRVMQDSREASISNRIYGDMGKRGYPMRAGGQEIARPDTQGGLQYDSRKAAACAWLRYLCGIVSVTYILCIGLLVYTYPLWPGAVVRIELAPLMGVFVACTIILRISIRSARFHWAYQRSGLLRCMILGVHALMSALPLVVAYYIFGVLHQWIGFVLD